MIPYVQQPVWHLGPLTIHAFGIAVALAMWVGLTLGQRGFERAALDPAVGNRLGGWVIAGGILGAHVFSVLLYFPQKLRDDPWLILRVWEDISSFGGMLGGSIAAFLFFSTRLSASDWSTRLRYLDVVALVFAPALAIGRVGCALAHDHPGEVTDFPLAISLKSEAAHTYLREVYASGGLTFPANAQSMGFHDLGLYEFLYLALVVVPILAHLNRRPRASGFYLLVFAALYFPVRFVLDTLRVADSRYLGLTPAQWGAAMIMAALPFAAIPHQKLRFAITGAVILGTAWACWGGSP
jgi:phosphatidylglycerol---prolipoprotein diacylglyceryl transferase